ncbi:MAG: hypothetical protein N2508_15710 [Anaerolineae bacterium]|nr:hypothetical protein [Anaerolineae bacterium]
MKRLRNVLSGVVGLLALAALAVGAGTLLRSIRLPSEAAGPPPPTAVAIPTVALNAMAPQRDQPIVVPSLTPEAAEEAAVDAPWFLVYGGEAPSEMAQVPHQWVPHILPLDEKGNPLGEPRPVIPRLPEDTPADWVCDGAIEPSPDGRYAIALPPMWAIPACVIDLRSGQAWPILQGKVIDWALWHPDGHRLVVGANHQIWLVDVPGGERIDLLDLRALGLWSDNVRRVVVLADGHVVLAVRTFTSPFQELDTIWVIDARSGKAEKLEEDVYFESLSLDRRTIYYRDEEAALKAMDGRGRDVVPDERFVEAQDLARGSPIWSPDGTKFVFCARERPLEKGQEDDGITGVSIYLHNPTTGQLQVLSRDSVYPTWSPDGSMIAFERRPEGRLVREIWIANADGSSLHQVTDDGRNKGRLWWLGGQR